MPFSNYIEYVEGLYKTDEISDDPDYVSVMCRLTYAVTRTEITTEKIMYDYEGWKIRTSRGHLSCLKTEGEPGEKQVNISYIRKTASAFPNHYRRSGNQGADFKRSLNTAPKGSANGRGGCFEFGSRIRKSRNGGLLLAPRQRKRRLHFGYFGDGRIIRNGHMRSQRHGNLCREAERF